MEKDIAIKVDNVSKTFRIPHEKVTSLRGAFVSALSRDKGYEEFKALDDVSFEVKKGEFFGIIGRNGSGKSTLLKVLAGIYRPDKGEVKVHGLISPFLELGIGFNPELSGRDNVYLNAAVLGLSHKQIDEKFDDIVEFSELRRFIDQKVKNYSSGMQVRLAFSVAIYANRDILLMDEVLAVGDSNFQSKCMEEFNKYKDAGKTVILVTHDIATVQRHCDRAILLRNGKIEMIGNSEDVGNEYIYQNMSDEEKRSVVEGKERRKKEKSGVSVEEIKLEAEKGRKVAKIIKVEFLDKNRKMKNAFQSDEDVFIRVFIDIKNTGVTYNFGFGLYNNFDHYIFGINTIIDKIDTKKYFRQGFFEIKLKNIKLLSNIYYIKASIVGDSFLSSTIYDYIARSPAFRVFSISKNEGIYEMDYDWC